MLDIGTEPPPLSIDDHAIVLKILEGEDGDAELMLWVNIITPDHALYMLSSAMQTILEQMVLRNQDHE